MRKVIDSLPSLKQIIITMVACLVLGVIIAGFHPKALATLAIGVLFLAMLTVRNYDPMKWEAYHDPLAHSMRLQRDSTVTRLQAIVDADSIGDTTALRLEVERARQHLVDLHSPTARR